jgi:hypothetical protein
MTSPLPRRRKVEHLETCGWRLYGPPAVCTCAPRPVPADGRAAAARISQASTWLVFEEQPAEPGQGTTTTWWVRAKRDRAVLGEIHWHGAWRQYVVAPMESTIFSAGCLDDIAAFCRAVHQVRRIP